MPSKAKRQGMRLGSSSSGVKKRKSSNSGLLSANKSKRRDQTFAKGRNGYIGWDPLSSSGRHHDTEILRELPEPEDFWSKHVLPRKPALIQSPVAIKQITIAERLTVETLKHQAVTSLVWTSYMKQGQMMAYAVMPVLIVRSF